MAATSQWEAFFDSHAPHYLRNPFTQHTVAEVDFLLEELRLPSGSCILDLGCGTGRHAVELARRGYQVTGVGLSPGMLAEAERAAREAGVTVTWIKCDATQFTATEQFDAAICLCEGAFGLLGLDDDPTAHDLTILRNLHAALLPGARLMLNALNGLAAIRQFSQEDVTSGWFDPVTMVAVLDEEWELPEGKRRVRLKERRYIPTELVALLGQAGFVVEHLWGGTAGNWGRRAIELDEIEIMAVARKARAQEES
ncbi:MAG: methyltransferase domain-containing protein [Chloroflexi bacterium]|nr:methyltransferase domain-containing protein [Chloroflexota bacterium]